MNNIEMCENHFSEDSPLINESFEITKPMDKLNDLSQSSELQTDRHINSDLIKKCDKKVFKLQKLYNKYVNCFETDIRWSHVLFMTTMHLIALHGLYVLLSLKIKVQSLLFAIFLHYICNLGLTAGVHRLWSHRSYKAKLPLRIFLMLCQTLTFQKSIITWSRDHRIHHKFSETIRDPHDIRRGVFFAHIGWIMLKKRPEVFEAGYKISLDDLYEDSVVRFQARTYLPMMILLCFVIPILTPVYCWSERWQYAFEVCVCLRHVIVLNISFLINSYSHTIGHRKYDLTFQSTDNKFLTVLSAGEGTHNYHHSFPQDYSASELKYVYNLTTSFIDLMAYLGQAYDLKRTAPDMIMARRKRTGDLSAFNKQKEN